MKIWEFVVKVANPYFSFPDDIQRLPEDLLSYAAEFAVKNKVFPLFYEGCRKLGIHLNQKAGVLISEFERRRRAQLEASKLLLEIGEKYGLELLFFKTFRPFNYVPDDIDILLRHRNDLELLVSLLGDKGYKLLKIGSPEVVVRKIWNGMYVDIDIHTSIAAGHLLLLKTENLWRSSTYKAVGDGYKIPVLSEHYEVVREVAYSLLKDFMISVPGFYCAINAVIKESLHAARRIAEEENLLPHVDLFLEVAHSIAYELFGSEAKPFPYERRNTSTVPLKLIRGDLRRRLRVPYPFPAFVVALAYLSKVRAEIQKDRNLEALLQLLKQPSSKGMDILLNYLRERLH